MNIASPETAASLPIRIRGCNPNPFQCRRAHVKMRFFALRDLQAFGFHWLPENSPPSNHWEGGYAFYKFDLAKHPIYSHRSMRKYHRTMTGIFLKSVSFPI